MFALPAGSTCTLLVSGEQTGGRFSAVEARVLHGAEPPRHVHGYEDEHVYVLAGQVTFCRDGELLDGPPGAWFVLPRGSEHGFTVESDEARLLFILSPAAPAHVLPVTRLPSRPDHDPAAASFVELLIATAARCGVTITEPGWQPGPLPPTP